MSEQDLIADGARRVLETHAARIATGGLSETRLGATMLGSPSPPPPETIMQDALAALSAFAEVGVLDERATERWNVVFNELANAPEHTAAGVSSEITQRAVEYLEALITNARAGGGRPAAGTLDQLKVALSALQRIGAVSEAEAGQWRERYLDARIAALADTQGPVLGGRLVGRVRSSTAPDPGPMHPHTRAQLEQQDAAFEQMLQDRSATDPHARDALQRRTASRFDPGTLIRTRAGSTRWLSGRRVSLLMLYEHAFVVHWHHRNERATDRRAAGQPRGGSRDFSGRDDRGNRYEPLVPSGPGTPVNGSAGRGPFVLRGQTILTPALDPTATSLQIQHGNDTFDITL